MANRNVLIRHFGLCLLTHHIQPQSIEAPSNTEAK